MDFTCFHFHTLTLLLVGIVSCIIVFALLPSHIVYIIWFRYLFFSFLFISSARKLTSIYIYFVKKCREKINRSNNTPECSAFERNVLGIDQNQWEKLTNGMCSTTPKQYVKKVHKKSLHCQKQNWLLVR